MNNYGDNLCASSNEYGTRQNHVALLFFAAQYAWEHSRPDHPLFMGTPSPLGSLTWAGRTAGCSLLGLARPGTLVYRYDDTLGMHMYQ